MAGKCAGVSLTRFGGEPVGLKNNHDAPERRHGVLYPKKISLALPARAHK